LSATARSSSTLFTGLPFTAVNGKPVKSVEELRAVADKAKGAVAILVRRGETTIFVPVEVS